MGFLAQERVEQGSGLKVPRALPVGIYFHQVGLAVLTAEALNGIWTSLYNSTLWRLERFNNSIVMGSLLFSLIFFIPLFLLSSLLIRRYRQNVLEWIRKTRLMQALRATRLYQAYRSVSGWGGEA